MKKLISLLVMIIMVVFIGACVPEGTPEVDYVTQEEFDVAIDVIDEKFEKVDNRFDNLIMSEGINEQRAYYENETPESEMYLSRIGYEFISQTEKDYLDKTKFPDYIWDEFGEYITVDDLGDLLTQKYFGINRIWQGAVGIWPSGVERCPGLCSRRFI